jgi:hypothetical protein
MTNNGQRGNDAATSDIAKKYMRILRQYESQDSDDSASARH